MNFTGIGESINNAGREFKSWFTDFTLVYSPIFIVLGLILTGIDLFLNLGIGNLLWFKIPWSIAQLFAVDGLWFAVWNRILTDEYKKEHIPYHAFLILVGLTLTSIAIVMTFVIFTQDYMGLRDSVAAMNYVGIPVSWFLFVRSVLLMLTATLAIVLDKVMRYRPKHTQGTVRRSNPIPVRSNDIPVPGTIVIPENKPPVLALPEPTKPGSKYDLIKSTIARYTSEGRPYTYKDIATVTGASLQTVKVYAPKIKKELEQ